MDALTAVERIPLTQAELLDAEYQRGLDHGARLERLRLGLHEACDPRPQGVGVRHADHGMVTGRPRVAPGNGSDASRANLDHGTPVLVVEHATRSSSRVVASRHQDAGFSPAGVLGEAGAVHKNAPATVAAVRGLDQQAREANR